MIEKIINNFINNNKTAYVIGGKKISFKKLLEKANSVAYYLIRNNIDRLLIIGDKQIEIIISILGTIIGGKTYIPIASDTPIERIRTIISESKPDAIINLSKINICDIKNIDIKNIKKYDKLLKLNYNKKNYAYIIFTSGTTGTPKGVPITYENLENFCNWLIRLEPIKDYHNINVLNQANFSFDLSVADLYYSWLTGNTLVALNKKIINNNLYEYIKKNKITFAVLTPTFLKMLLLNPDFNSDNYNIKCFYLCGEYLDIALAKKIYSRFIDINLINAYGPTECTSAVSSVLINKKMLNKKELPIGNISNAASDIEIINQEIVIKGKSVFNGYLNGENSNKIYYTKDRGYIKNDYLYFLGRMDTQIKLNGYRIELLEIENIIKNNKNVIDAAVVAKKINNEVKRIDAYVICSKKTNLKIYLKQYLPNYMIPKNIFYVSVLPVNINNKLERKTLE